MPLPVDLTVLLNFVLQIMSSVYNFGKKACLQM